MRRDEMMVSASALVVLIAGGIAAGGPTILAGDKDDFGSVEAATQRPDFATWLSATGNNTNLHFGDPMPFDMDSVAKAQAYNGSSKAHDWDFGYSFENLPKLKPGATLTIRLKALNSSLVSNDALELWFTNGTPTLLWVYHIADLTSNKQWNPGQVEEITLDLSNLPKNDLRGLGGGSVVGLINTFHFLDVSVQDDTAVDWIELMIPSPGSAALLGLAAPMALGRRRR